MINHLTLLAFGGSFIASIALFVTFMRVSRLAAAETNWTGLRFNHEFVSALSVGLGALGLAGVSLIRTVDGLNGADLGGSAPLGLLISLLLLWASYSGFHWAATLNRARWQWRIYVALLCVWLSILAWQAFAG